MDSRDPVIALPIEVAWKSLTREDERDLSFAILSGKDEGNRAYKELVEANLRLVRKIAHDYKGMGVSLKNLISSGNIGLLKAATKFDIRKGAKFSSYAQWWINRSIREEIARNSNPLSVSPSTMRRARKLATVSRAFEDRHGYEPDDAELAAASKETARRVRCLSVLSRLSFSSIEHSAEMGHELAAEQKEVFADDDTVYRLRSCLLRLSEKERAVIDGRFCLSGPQMTLKAIGRRLGLTSERVRQIEAQALQRLRKMMEGGK